MSAIFGIINKNGKPVELTEIQAMQSALKHRAVDGSGIYHSGNTLIGHQNFVTSIYQKQGCLPFEDDTYIITCDARIDNRLELANTLNYKSKYPAVHDSLVILEAYKKWRENCTNYLEGEFAFVIWNKQTQTLFAATDHIGFKRFYYYDAPDQFIFATEIKGIRAVKQTPVVFNEQVIAEYFTKQYTHITFDKNIFTLPAASYLSLGLQQPLTVTKYWSIGAKRKYSFRKEEDWAECLRELLIKAVQNRLYTEGLTGITLSGGLDSSFVAAIAATILQKQNKVLHTFSSVLPEGYTGKEKDERFYINALGKQYGNIEQTFVWPPLSIGPFSDLPTVFTKTERLVNAFHYMDEAICQAAQQKNITILLNGFGGDMSISNKGKDVIYRLLKSGNFSKALHYFKWKKTEKNLWDNVESSSSFLRTLKSEILDNTLFFRYLYNPVKTFSRSEIPLTGHLLRSTLSKWHTGTHPYTQHFRQRINSGSLGKTIDDVCAFSPYYRLETHIPILHKSINEFYFDVPPEQFVIHDQQRSLMRRAMIGYVPAEIINRTDKKPYTPDFSQRLLLQQDHIKMALKKEAVNENNYLDKQVMQKQFTALLNSNGQIASTSVQLSVTKSVLVNDFIEWVAINK